MASSAAGGTAPVTSSSQPGIVPAQTTPVARSTAKIAECGRQIFFLAWKLLYVLQFFPDAPEVVNVCKAYFSESYHLDTIISMLEAFADSENYNWKIIEKTSRDYDLEPKDPYEKGILFRIHKGHNRVIPWAEGWAFREKNVITIRSDQFKKDLIRGTGMTMQDLRNNILTTDNMNMVNNSLVRIVIHEMTHVLWKTDDFGAYGILRSQNLARTTNVANRYRHADGWSWFMVNK
ncbi:hypothetical protein H2200_011228 [Cladophialophora chaetospira]|uniref:Uncharacterized protein n=1 Tax=Cladophialophora chaetospira TaxID=386627 RepID=A0AA38X084_9EURO|nr:hypothetical protein H2200_011228 [Cladophialophora chaetospira]